MQAIERAEAAGKRFFITTGHFSNKEIVEIVRKRFPALSDKLPGKDVKGGDYPEGGVYTFDNSQSERVLGIKWRSLEESIVDTVKSLQAAGA